MSRIVMLHSETSDPRESTFHLRRVASLSATAQSYWDAGLVCRHANRACQDWFGIDPELMVGASLKDFFETLGLSPWLACADRARRGEASDVLQAFERGDIRREGLVRYVPDFLADRFAGLLIEVSPVPGRAQGSRHLKSLLGW